ncbi:glycoside hydrolase 43 family protein [Chitinophaga sp. Hz27]|uniref:glycoside hydrolase family 43 protein n=1 Tax=Chitinophaga sp. Hz27 TaxID=3347169 RepID=UPI0035D8C024
MKKTGLLNIRQNSKYKICCLLIFIFTCTMQLKAQETNVWSPDNGNGTFTNPLMWGDWPDPDVIRVGDYFYLISTSMHYVPGSPIARSQDLVNWEIAGYAIDHYTEDPKFDMNGGTLYLNGSWANTIRYNNGKFYVGFCTPNGWGRDKGNFSICTATTVNGPWERTIFPNFFYDPGLFFDDNGKVYVVHGQKKLYITELNKDVKSAIGPDIKIWERGFKNADTIDGGFGMEGSHMYKINGKYYITCPAGGTEGWQVCLRSDSIYGPYEYKVILHDDSSYPPNGLHQGGMVQLKNGDWWFIIMQDRGPIGRVPNLVPVKWVDGWPMLGDGKKDVITYAKPNVGKVFKKMSPATSDEFNQKKLGLQWQWNHNPDNAKWSLTEHAGYLRLKASRADSLKVARNTLTQRVQGPGCEGTVEITLKGLKNGNVAGFGIFQFPYAYVAVEMKDNKRSIIMCNDEKIIESIDDIKAEKIWIRSRVTDRDFIAKFYYSLDGKEFYAIGNDLKMQLGLDWTANRFALFNYSKIPEGIDGYADFNWFHFTNK